MKISSWVEIIVLIVLIITLIVFLVKVQSDGAKCIANPLSYSIKAMSERNNVDMSCYCQFDSSNLLPLTVNKSGLFSTNVVQGSFKI